MRVLHGLLLTTLLAACEPGTQAPSPPTAPIAVAQRMAAPPDPGFARALVPRPFVFPDDHGAHPAFATEWWYFTGNLQDDAGRPFGYQLTLFRIGLRPGTAPADSAWRSHQLYMAHLAISDIADRRHHSAERFSRAAAGLAGAHVSPLAVWLGPWSIHSTGERTFPLRLRAQSEGFALDLQIERGPKALVPQGERGLSRKGAAPGNASYYYSLTRLPTRGELRIGERRHTVSGNSWFDREWSSSALAADQAGWDWFALQLDDGRDLMFYRMRGTDGKAQRFSNGVLVDAEGQAQRLDAAQVDVTPDYFWRNEDGVGYPLGWHLRVPAHGLDLRIRARFDDQEMRHAVRYWEGAVGVSGSHAGVGYLELSGYGQRPQDGATSLSEERHADRAVSTDRHTSQ